MLSTFYHFSLLLFGLSTNGPTLAYFFASWLFLFHRRSDGPMSTYLVQRVTGCDVLPFRQCSFLSCLLANGPTVRLFGNTLQAVRLFSLHSVTRVPFLSTDSGFASIPLSLAPFTSLQSVDAPFVFSYADCYLYTIGTYPFRALTVMSSVIGLYILQ